MSFEEVYQYIYIGNRHSIASLQKYRSIREIRIDEVTLDDRRPGCAHLILDAYFKLDVCNTLSLSLINLVSAGISC